MCSCDHVVITRENRFLGTRRYAKNIPQVKFTSTGSELSLAILSQSTVLGSAFYSISFKKKKKKHISVKSFHRKTWAAAMVSAPDPCTWVVLRNTLAFLHWAPPKTVFEAFQWIHDLYGNHHSHGPAKQPVYRKIISFGFRWIPDKPLAWGVIISKLFNMLLGKKKIRDM